MGTHGRARAPGGAGDTSGNLHRPPPPPRDERTSCSPRHPQSRARGAREASTVAQGRGVGGTVCRGGPRACPVLPCGPRVWGRSPPRPTVGTGQEHRRAGRAGRPPGQPGPRLKAGASVNGRRTGNNRVPRRHLPADAGEAAQAGYLMPRGAREEAILFIASKQTNCFAPRSQKGKKRRKQRKRTCFCPYWSSKSRPVGRQERAGARLTKARACPVDSGQRTAEP